MRRSWHQNSRRPDQIPPRTMFDLQRGPGVDRNDVECSSTPAKHPRRHFQCWWGADDVWDWEVSNVDFDQYFNDVPTALCNAVRPTNQTVDSSRTKVRLSP